MELKLRKRIKNRLPGYEKGKPVEGENTEDENTNNNSLGGKGGENPSSAAGMGPWFALGEWAGTGVGTGINEIVNTRPSSLRADAGVSQSQINGMYYLKENEIDIDQAEKDYNRTMHMSFLTNPFKGLTMLFGRKKARRNMLRARQEQEAVNDMARASASSDYLQQEYASRYGNPQDQILYAKNGKDAVQSAYGEVNITPNSKTEGGEVIYNAQQLTAHVVPGKAKGDTNLASVNPSDIVITNKFGLAQKVRPAAKALQSLNKQKKNRSMLGAQTDDLIRKLATAQLNEAAEEQAQMRQAGMLKQPQYGKYIEGKAPNIPLWDTEKWRLITDPAFWNINDQPSGKPADVPTIDIKPLNITFPEKQNKNRNFPSNWWIDGFSTLTNAGQIIADALQKPKRSNTYAQNPYSRYALNKLFGLHINPYPIMKDLYDQERRNIYAINRAGGLSGAQKVFANVASGIGTQNAIAAALADIQKQNNAYTSDASKYMINAGQADRTARMAANQWDLDYYSKSHAAKQLMMQQDIYNALAALQQGYKNSYKKYEFDNIMDRYTA